MISGDRSVEDFFEGLPPVKQDSSLRQEIYRLWKQSGRKLIVLDDDPTGVQTVHDVDVITEWSPEWIRRGLAGESHVLFILTNTRSYEPGRAEAINRAIMRNLAQVARELGVEFSVISRGDSTLRGHYPLEISVIADELAKETGHSFDGHLIIPAFFEGGRYTLRGTHYLQEGQRLVPVHQTEFAKDAVFGFTDAYLPNWVVEKGGAQTPDEVRSISLEDIRAGGVEGVLKLLLSLRGNVPVIINAVSYADLDIVSMALMQAMAAGKRFLYRTAASFVKSFAGIRDRGYLSAEEMKVAAGKSHGGLIIVGSHTKKTTEQLNELKAAFPVQTFEINVEHILDDVSWEQETAQIGALLARSIADGTDTVIYTSRYVVKAAKSAENLGISQKISASLAKIVRELSVVPKFIVAKGGITSSDIATQGLNIKKAKVLGQAAAGIPVWLTGDEAIFARIPYIVFPGNVGEPDTLADIVGSMKS